MLSRKILAFYKSLSLTVKLPNGVAFMNPYQDKKAFEVCSAFYNKYYSDSGKRKMILGINPGRFGGGITGIPFTDPVKLETWCGITNEFAKKTELSADFIYLMIDACGGPEKFYGNYYISALSPLGFTKDGKNLNYYDIRELQEAVEPFMIDCLNQQLDFNIDNRTAYCLGEGTNYKYLMKLNSRFHFFDSIEPLPHPRFIMQYKRKKLQEYVDLYVEKLFANNS
jgi:hypothetical protein